MIKRASEENQISDLKTVYKTPLNNIDVYSEFQALLLVVIIEMNTPPRVKRQNKSLKSARFLIIIYSTNYFNAEYNRDHRGNNLCTGSQYLSIDARTPTERFCCPSLLKLINLFFVYKPVPQRQTYHGALYPPLPHE